MTAIAFAIVALVGAAPAQQIKPSDAGDAWRIVRSAQAAVETGTEARYEREWTAAVSRNPNDRRALLALAALAQQRYQYERADSLYDRIIRLQPAGSQYTAAAHVSMALWRAIGSDVVRADSLFMLARAEDLGAGDWHIAFQALVNVGKLRSRRAGPKVGLELLREARSIATNPTPDETRRAAVRGRLAHGAGRRHHGPRSTRRGHSRGPQERESAS